MARVDVGEVVDYSSTRMAELLDHLRSTARATLCQSEPAGTKKGQRAASSEVGLAESLDWTPKMRQLR